MSLDWWQENVIYHIYLPSFKDSNNDGIGDFQGLLSKLDYLKELPISTLLLSPFFPSPMKDNGYDITSYIDVDPKYGTLNDFDVLVQEIKERGMNIILDFVANHTSDQHPWFIKSVRKEEPYTDFYIWIDKKPGSTNDEPEVPNNWLSVFGNSAWTWNKERKQFYFHQFLAEQPDLNYHNDLVRHEMLKVLMFWLERGVDGFRIDAASHLFEDKRLLDEPLARQSKAKENQYEYLSHIYTKGQEDTFELLAEWRHILDQYSKKENKPKIMLIEAMEEVSEVMLYFGKLHQRLAEIPMNFQLYKVSPKSTGIALQEILDEWLKKLPKGKYSNWVMSSHDFSRVVSRVGTVLAGSLHMVMMLLPGTPIWYYGDELGMQNGIIAPEQTRDSFALRTVPSNSRDPMRTAMQWSREKNAGFTDSDKPWLPVNADYKSINVEVERADPFSFLSNFKKLIQIRTESSILLGTFEYLLVNTEFFSFLRAVVGAKCYLVVVNMSDSPIIVDMTAANSSMPSSVVMEVTNPEYYSQIRLRYGKKYTVNGPSCSNASEDVTQCDMPEDEIILSLNDIHLEGNQAMVLSYIG